MSRAERLWWAASAMLLAAVGVCWAVIPGRLPQAWLAGFVAFSLWPLGSLGLLFVHALTGGRWGEALRPGLLAGASATPLLAPLAVPVMLSLSALYPWARPEGASLPNRFWLNPAGFAVRGAVEFAVWAGLSLLAVRGGPLRRVAPVALVALALSVTFASIDLTMSLDPRFTSSAYGMIAGAAAVVLALAASILLARPAEARRDDIGRLLLALCALWAYLDFMQVLIVWQSDLVSQTPWYLARARGAWGWVMAAVAVMHGVVPILALMSPTIRQSRRGLAGVAALLVTAELVRAWWTVLPPRLPGLPELCCMGAAVALAVAMGLGGVRRHA